MHASEGDRGVKAWEQGMGARHGSSVGKKPEKGEDTTERVSNSRGDMTFRPCMRLRRMGLLCMGQKTCTGMIQFQAEERMLCIEG